MGLTYNTSEWMRKKKETGELDTGNSPVLDGDTSIFDPVLTEISYLWFSAKGWVVIDPFAGGSVRGLVAGKMGRVYHGVDLRQEQIDANFSQVPVVINEEGEIPPNWYCGDSINIDTILQGIEADFVFSCPPYADLEIYSDDPRDISTMKYPDFIKTYREIVKKACSLLKPNRFACFVVGEVRDKNGNYYNFVGDTVQAFIDAGLTYYNESILVTSAGSLAIRVEKQFATSRKVGKTHQNVLVFLKGDAKIAAKECGLINFSEEHYAGSVGGANDD